MADVRRAAAQWLDSLRRGGVTHLPKRAARAAAATVETSARTTVESEESVKAERLANSSRSDAPPRPVAESTSAQKFESRREEREIGQEDRAAALAALAAKVAQCRRCDELVRNRTQTVFGVGNPYAELVFVGEAPGADEDLRGEPFVGAAGQLLNKIIAACGLKREEVYIMNILRCRPPNNRTPLPDEAERCRPFLLGQLGIIRPKFICCLGACAAQNLLQTTETIGRLRGRFFDFQGARVICTYHPAYLLRNPSAKRQTWEDMQMLLRAMGREIPK